MAFFAVVHGGETWVGYSQVEREILLLTPLSWRKLMFLSYEERPGKIWAEMVQEAEREIHKKWMN